jgi:tetratricopeptide (TPR) repeat protein
MKSVVPLVLIAVVFAVDVPPAFACLWDYDTIKEESLGDKEVAQVVKGELRKHSTEFYAAKVTYTRAIVEAGNAKQERYDDYAVALAKTGKLDEAIAVLADKDKKFPGEYTTEANLGTFLAMKGDTAGALDHLAKAVAINPDAHFGREIVQIQLLEYVQKLAADPTLDTKQTFLGSPIGEDVLITRTKRNRKVSKAIDTQVKGIVGLIRFGDGDQNPHLWFGLAWALVERGDNQLAMYAFRRAEQLGHKVAGVEGARRAGVIRNLVGEESGDNRHLAWGKVTPVIDAAWAKGQAADARRQAAEDKQIAKQRWKAAFGY